MRSWRGVGLLLGLAVACSQGRGRVETRYPNGHPRVVVETLNGTPEGAATTYHQNGAVSSRGTHHRGLRHGLFEFFDASGVLTRRVIYRNGVEIWSSSAPAEAPPPALLAATRVPSAAELDVAPEFAPDFATTDRVRAGRRLIAQLGFHSVDPPAATAAAGQRIEVFGEHELGPGAAYVDVASSRLAETSMSPGGAGKTTAEAGAAIATRRRRGAVLGTYQLLARAGLLVPLAGDDLDGYYVASHLMYERLTDGVAAFPRSMAIRPAGSLIGQRDAFFYRADVGMDLALSIAGEDDVRMPDPVLVLGRVNAAVGYAYQTLGVTAEVANLVALTGDAVAERLAHSLTLAVQLRPFEIRPRLGITTPLDSAAAGNAFALFASVEWVPGGDR